MVENVGSEEDGGEIRKLIDPAAPSQQEISGHYVRVTSRIVTGVLFVCRPRVGMTTIKGIAAKTADFLSISLITVSQGTNVVIS